MVVELSAWENNVVLASVGLGVGVVVLCLLGYLISKSVFKKPADNSGFIFFLIIFIIIGVAVGAIALRGFTSSIISRVENTYDVTFLDRSDVDVPVSEGSTTVYGVRDESTDKVFAVVQLKKTNDSITLLVPSDNTSGTDFIEFER